MLIFLLLSLLLWIFIDFWCVHPKQLFRVRALILLLLLLLGLCRWLLLLTFLCRMLLHSSLFRWLLLLLSRLFLTQRLVLGRLVLPLTLRLVLRLTLQLVLGRLVLHLTLLLVLPWLVLACGRLRRRRDGRAKIWENETLQWIPVMISGRIKNMHHSKM